MARPWPVPQELREFLDRQGVMVFWDLDDARAVLVGGQAVGLPPMMLMTPEGLWLAPDERKAPDWWGSGWDFAHKLEPLPEADVPALIQEARRQYYDGLLDED